MIDWYDFGSDLIIVLMIWVGVSIILLFVFPMTAQPIAVSECGGKPIGATAQCLRDYVASFHNYSVRSDVPRSLEDIKENGGDCYDYSRLYVNFATSLGFHAKKIRIDGDDSAHGFVIMWEDDLDYCILEQELEPYCVYFN